MSANKSITSMIISVALPVIGVAFIGYFLIGSKVSPVVEFDQSAVSLNHLIYH